MARFNSALTSNTISGATAIGSPYSGAFTEFTGAAPYTVTLPLPSLFPGVTQTFYNATSSPSGIVTLSSTANFVGTGGPGTSTVSVFAGNVINIVSDGTNYVVISEDGSPLSATTGSFSSNVTMNGGSATVSITPSVLTVAPTASSNIDNVAIGSTTKASGAFTTLTANNAVTFTAGTASSTTGTGSLVVSGGLGVSGTVYASGFNGNLTGTLQTSAQPNITSTGALTVPSLISNDTASINGLTTTQYFKINVPNSHNRAAPATTGTTPAGVMGTITGASLNQEIDFGISNSSAVFWIQNTNKTAYNVNYPIVLNPNGGEVGIGGGASAPVRPLHVVGLGTVARFETSSTTNATVAEIFAPSITTGQFARLAWRSNVATTVFSGIDTYFQNLTASSETADIAFSTINGSAGLTEKLRITSAGNILVATNGTLTVPNQNSFKTTGTVYPVTRPNLVLDFANSKGVDARITFTRNSVGSYYDENGILRYAAANQPRINYDPATLEPKGLLIEESRTNLITYSDHLTNSYWTIDAGGVGITNGGAAAPDGSMSADVIQETTASGVSPRFIKSTPWSTLNNITFTFSLHVKTSGAKRNIFMLCQDSANAFYAHFDIVAGTVTNSNNSGTGVYSGAGIQNVGNGWFRIWISGRIPSTAIYTMATLGAVGSTGFGATTYTGDGVSGFSAWGAQIEVGAFPTSYIQSTLTFWGRNSTATYFDSVGMLRTIEINRPRNHYVHNAETGQMSSVGLLIESQKTNVANVSFAGFAGTKTTDQPDPAGGSTAVLFSGTPPNNGYITGQPIANATTYCVSAFVKAGSSSQVNFGCESGFPNGYSGVISYDISTGVIGTNANAKGYMRPVGNGWYRIWWVSTSTGTSATVHIASTGINAFGIQIETGTTPTSYIPTNTTRTADFVVDSTTTRAVDNAVMFNMGSVLNSTQGTVISTWESQGAPTAGGVPGIFELLAYSGTGGIDQRSSAFYYGDNYALSTGGYTYNSGYTTRAIAYQSTNTKIFTNGSLTASNTVHTVIANLDKILLGSIDNAVASSYPLNGHIKRLVYYPKRLTDTEVIALTTQ
jgi:hypothetical protein